MMTDFRFVRGALHLSVLALLPCCVALAQISDEDSLFAQEDLAVSEAVSGALPDAGGSVDILGELFADESIALPAADELDIAFPEVEPIAEPAAESMELPLEALLPQSLDAVTEGIAAEPAADIDDFPLDAGFDAGAVLDEMLEMGDSEAVKELGAVEAEPAADRAEAPAAPRDDMDLEAMLGEMVAEEKTVEETPAMAEGETQAPAVVDDAVLDLLTGDESAGVPAEMPAAVEEPIGDLDALFSEPVAVETVPAEMPAAVEEPIGDLDALFGEPVVVETVPAEMPAAVEEPIGDLDALFGEPVVVETVPAEIPEAVEEPIGDLDALFSEPVAVETVRAEIPAAVEEPIGDLDALFGEPVVVETVPAEIPAAVEEPIGDLDALIGELAIEAEAELGGGVTAVEAPVIPETTPVIPAVEEETTALVEIAEDPPPIESSDPMALDDDIFKDLAGEVTAEVRKSPLPSESGTKAPEVAADPFAGLSGDLVGEADAGVKPVEPSSPAFLPAAEPTVVPVAAPPSIQGAAPVPGPAVEGVAAFEEAERLKRKAQEYHARNTLISADKALRDKDYPRAIRLYEEARRHMPRRADTEPLQAQIRKGLGASYYLQALSLERMEDLENAKISAQNAARNGYPRAEEAVARIQRRMDAPEPPPPSAAATVRWKEDEYKTMQTQIRSWLKRGREAYLTGEYERAILAFESVLARDPENKEAIRLMHSAANKQYDRSTMELNATSARMMASVRDTWNPRQYGLHEAPIRDDGRMVTDRQEDEIQRMAILAKMGMIRIPEVDFRQANIRDVVNFLFAQSAEFDPDPVPANRKGVNIILKLDTDGPGAAPAAALAPADPFAAFPAAGGGGGAGGLSETLVTFNARDITLKEALDIVVDIAGLKYLIRGNVVMVMPRNAAVGEIEHRMYDVLPSAITRLQELSSAVAGGGGAAGGRRGGGDFLSLEPSGGVGGEDTDLKVFFTEMGVAWPNTSSIKFVRGLGKLVVANTIENLAVFEKVLSILNVVPYQIEIEARFIEVAQTDVDSLGLEWLLNDNWEIAQKKGSAGLPLAQRERIQMNANASQGGFTAGNRFISGAGLAGPSGTTMVDEIARLSGVLTNPELTVVLHALQQRGHTDLLSAPKITTQSGQQATIKVVTEYIYPTDFETSGIGGDNAGANAAGGAAGGGVVGAVVTPREFVTREVGVILEVLPEVSPEGQMINLTLSPEVVSEPTWRNFGSTYTSYDPNGNPIVQTLNMEQPFFHTRKLKTSLLIYNGATVVMGGMITEVRSKVDDKVPLLGDIPLLGRLFRSQYESSEKRNLLIFVTARLVDPAGRALDRERFSGDKSIAERLTLGGDAAAAKP